MIIPENLESAILEYPVLQYGSLPSSEVGFHQRVREICKNECPRYGSSWSCPPAVGTVEECRQKCLAYTDCFVFSTIAEVNDITNMEETLATRMDHEDITHSVLEIFRQHYGDAFALSTESCDICSTCAYPNAPCRCPDRMYPCVESYGIIVTELAEKTDMEFQNGANVVTWFSVIFYNSDAYKEC